MTKRALGDQALHLIHQTGERLRELDRNALRQRVEEASVRPTPGSSDLLGRPLSVRTCAGIDDDGNLRAVDLHDLIGLAPIHLLARGLKLRPRASTSANTRKGKET